MKILQVIGQLGLGGAETMIMTLFREVKKDGIIFDFFICTDEDNYYEKEALRLGAHVFKSVPKSVSMWKYCKDLYTVLKKEKYDIVHVHASDSYAAIPIFIAWLARVPVKIAHSHNSTGNMNPYVQKVLQKLLNICCDKKLACSYNAGNWMYGKGDHLFFENPIDVRKFRFSMQDRIHLRQKYGLKKEKAYIHVGRFSRQKNHRFLIDIFHDLHKLQPDAKLFLIGCGEDEDMIKHKVKSLHLEEAIVFIGKTSNVHTYLSMADIFLFPSLYEGFPLTLIEAQSSGLPCYVSKAITTQVKITDLVSFISLDISSQDWAYEIVKDTCTYEKRELYNEKIYASYDIEKVANKLMSIYGI